MAGDHLLDSFPVSTDTPNWLWHEFGDVDVVAVGRRAGAAPAQLNLRLPVEQAVVSHPAVLECAVIAIPDEKWGEVPKAFVTLKPGRGLTAEELVAHVRTVLPGLQGAEGDRVRRAAQEVDGKVQKFVLRDREWGGREKRIN